VHITSIYPLFYQSAKNYQSWWKFNKVMTKKILHSFLRHGVHLYSPRMEAQQNKYNLSKLN